MTKKKRLGRGLDALLSKPVAETAAVIGDTVTPTGDTLRQIPVDLLQRDDVGVGDLPGNARQIIAAVGTKPELNIVTDAFHRVSFLIRLAISG